MITNTTPGTHKPRISTQTVTNRLLEISERPPYTMYDLYAAFLFWPSICHKMALGLSRPRYYQLFFMLNSTEHVIHCAHQC